MVTLNLCSSVIFLLVKKFTGKNFFALVGMFVCICGVVLPSTGWTKDAKQNAKQSARAEKSAEKSAEKPAEKSHLDSQIPSGYPKKLTLDLVMGIALNQAETFKNLRAQKEQVEGPKNLSLAGFDPQLQLKTSVFESRAESSTPFNPERVQGHQASVGVSKYFSTGTTIAAALLHKYSESKFDPSLPFAGGLSTISAYDSQLSLQVSQNLWRDGFGKASRAGIAVGEKSSELASLGNQRLMGQTALQLIQAYYGAWLAQTRTQVARADLARRKRLLSNTMIKSRLGTAERPDVLQIQSGVILTETQLNSAIQELQNRWRELIIILGLADELLSFDPEKIPIEIGELPGGVEQICQTQNASQSLEVQQSILQKEIASINIEKAESETDPDLQLRGELANNEIDEDRSKSLSGSSNGQHPAWNVELALTIPLGGAAKAGRTQVARTESLNAELQHSQVQDAARVLLINECKNVARLQELRQQLEILSKNQSERSDLEERRFRIGRATLFSVIQADDDASQAGQIARSTEAELRLSMWKLLHAQAQMQTHFDKWQGMKYE